MFRHERSPGRAAPAIHQFGVSPSACRIHGLMSRCCRSCGRLLSDLTLPGLTRKSTTSGMRDRAVQTAARGVLKVLKADSAGIASDGSSRTRCGSWTARYRNAAPPQSATPGRFSVSAGTGPFRTGDGRPAVDWHSVSSESSPGPGPRCIALTAFEVTCSHLGAQNAVGPTDGTTVSSNSSVGPPLSRR